MATIKVTQKMIASLSRVLDCIQVEDEYQHFCESYQETWEEALSEEECEVINDNLQCGDQTQCWALLDKAGIGYKDHTFYIWWEASTTLGKMEREAEEDESYMYE